MHTFLYKLEMSLRRRFKLVTAFSSDYDVGHLCAKVKWSDQDSWNPVCVQVNQEFCQLQGYEWAEAVLSKEEMLDSVSPRNHCTWYKVCQFALLQIKLMFFSAK